MSGRYLVRDFIIDEYKIAVNAVLTKALQGMETDNFEFPFITKSGQRVEVLLNATTRRDATNKVVGVVGVGQDITELKRGKAELQRVANDLRQLIDTANAPIFGIDAEGLVNEVRCRARSEPLEAGRRRGEEGRSGLVVAERRGVVVARRVAVTWRSRGGRRPATTWNEPYRAVAER